MVKVKICGITNLEDALAAVAAGADALGFLFYKKSPRYISPVKASRIIRQLPKRVTKVGIFVNAREATIRKIAKVCRLDMLQFHGNESAGFCDRFKEHKIIKSIRVRSKKDLRKIINYNPSFFLFDTFTKSKLGGSGKSFDWSLLRCIEKFKQPVFLSGGLNEKNVGEAIRIVSPGWVDVSSSVESAYGRKDHNKLKNFIRKVKKRG